MTEQRFLGLLCVTFPFINKDECLLDIKTCALAKLVSVRGIEYLVTSLSATLLLAHEVHKFVCIVLDI